MYLCMYVCMYVCMCIHTYIHIYMYVYMYVCMYVCVYIYIYIYIYIYGLPYVCVHAQFLLIKREHVLVAKDQKPRLFMYANCTYAYVHAHVHSIRACLREHMHVSEHACT